MKKQSKSKAPRKKNRRANRKSRSRKSAITASSANDKSRHCPGCGRRFGPDLPAASVNVQKTPNVNFWFNLCVACVSEMPNLSLAKAIEVRVVGNPGRYAQADYGLAHKKPAGSA